MTSRNLTETGSKLGLLALGAAALALLASCGKKSEETTLAEAPEPAPVEEAAPAPVEADFAAIAAAAVADERRPEADIAQDERRKPAMALEFFQIYPGATVFEVEAGGGYFTEILSHAVGADGEIIMQNPESFLAFVGEQIDQRLAGDRLPNVRKSLTNFDALDAPDGSVDVATWVQGPHELFFVPSEGVSLGDPARAYAEIFRVLRSGGAFVVIDHAAIEGAPETSGNDLHRIDPAIVKDMASLAGFELDGDSDFLGNPEDDKSATVFAPEIRGNTDQFTLRFRKP